MSKLIIMNTFLISFLLIFSLKSFAQDEDYEVLNQINNGNALELIETPRFEDELKYLEKIEDNALSDASDTLIEDQISTNKSAIQRSPSIIKEESPDTNIQELVPSQNIRRIRSR